MICKNDSKRSIRTVVTMIITAALCHSKVSVVNTANQVHANAHCVLLRNLPRDPMNLIFEDSSRLSRNFPFPCSKNKRNKKNTSRKLMFLPHFTGSLVILKIERKKSK